MESNTLDSNLINEVNTNDFDNYASSGRRLLNSIIDTIAIYLLYFAVIFFVQLSTHAINDTSMTGFLIYPFIIAYYIFMEATTGKTIGKFLTGTKVVTEDGEKPTFKTALIRTICRFIPFEAFSFLGSPGNGWHDSIAKSKVILDR